MRSTRALASADPFFERPYEAATDAAPAWEHVKVESAPSRPALRPKKKVASLLGG